MSKISLTLFAVLAIISVAFATRFDCTRQPNEVYSCGSACQTTCATLGQTCPIINVKCNEGCYCIDGYARNSKNICIPISQCPRKSHCKGSKGGY